MAKAKPSEGSEQLAEVVFAWKAPTDVRYKKNVWWYVISFIVLVLLVWWSIAEGRWFGDKNYIFAVFLVLFYLVVLIDDFREPEEAEFVVTPDGVKWGDKFYYYKELSEFFIIYRENGIKNLYIDFTNPLKGRIIVSVDGQDAVSIREYLLNFLKEDLDREVEPLSERIRRWLRL
jgi:hypothetical protein